MSDLTKEIGREQTGLVRRVRIHPEAIVKGNDPRITAKKMLRQDVKKTPFVPDLGYIILLIAVNDVGDGYCLPQLGFIEYAVTFEAVIFCPIIGQVVDAVVQNVTPTCIMFNHCGVHGVVRSYCLSDTDNFAFERQEGEDGVFRSQNYPEKIIGKGTTVRLRVTQRTLGGNGFFIVGSMAGEYLGPLINQDEPYLFVPSPQAPPYSPIPSPTYSPVPSAPNYSPTPSSSVPTNELLVANSTHQPTSLNPLSSAFSSKTVAFREAKPGQFSPDYSRTPSPSVPTNESLASTSTQPASSLSPQLPTTPSNKIAIVQRKPSKGILAEGVKSLVLYGIEFSDDDDSSDDSVNSLQLDP